MSQKSSLMDVKIEIFSSVMVLAVFLTTYCVAEDKNVNRVEFTLVSSKQKLKTNLRVKSPFGYEFTGTL